MKIGIWKKICIGVAFVGLAASYFGSTLLAQDSFREFDRKLVATPAELFNALSKFNPSAERPSMDPKRMKEMEKIGRDLLSSLSPEQKEEAWEFAEKYLRKNGVDAASSRELMTEFGIPPEMQNELSKQLRKYSGEKSKYGSNRDRQRDDEIGRLLQKAKQKFEQVNRQPQKATEKSPESAETNRTTPTGKDGNLGRDDLDRNIQRDNTQVPQPRNEDGTARNRNDNRRPRPNPPRVPKSTRPRPGGEPDSPFGQPLSDPGNKLTEEELRKRFENRQLGTRKPKDSANKPLTNPRLPESRRNLGSDADIERMLERLGGLRKQNAGGQGGNSSGRSRGKGAGINPDIDWEKVIEGLAQRDMKGLESALGKGNLRVKSGSGLSNRNGENGSKLNVDKDMLGRAQDLISNAFKSKNKSDSNRGVSGMAGSGNSNEKIGTRFDRLLVKAVDRTLSSDGEQGVSEGVGGMLGNLIERFQDQAARKKEERERESAARRSSNERNRSNSSQRDRSSRSNAETASSGSSNRRSENGSRSSNSSNDTSSPATQTPSLGSGSLSDMVPDLSSINPMVVFTFFGIVGGVLFIGYLLAQSLTGNEAESTKRAVIKKVRNTKIRSPKDLVDTVDMFLLAKFGIRSSWWNANLAQRILHSDSPELQSEVDELFRDYVRARYMRNDIQIPAADQNRFRKTLEQLSRLDIKPGKGLDYAASKPTVSLEG